MKPIGAVALECFLDLGITIVYATLAGLLIVAVVASDDGFPSFWTMLLWTSLLPAAVALFIGIDVVIRVVMDHRASRPRPSTALCRARPRGASSPGRRCAGSA